MPWDNRSIKFPDPPIPRRDWPEATHYLTQPLTYRNTSTSNTARQVTQIVRELPTGTKIAFIPGQSDSPFEPIIVADEFPNELLVVIRPNTPPLEERIAPLPATYPGKWEIDTPRPRPYSPTYTPT